MTTARPASARRVPVGQGIGVLTLGRVVDQGALGLTALLLAARSSLEEYATVGVVLVLNSLCVTLSDRGLGFEALRLRGGERLAAPRLAGLRRWNTAAAALGVVAGAVLGGELGLVVGGTAAIWLASGEAYVRKSAAIQRGRSRSVVVAEVTASVLLLAVVVLAARGEAAAEWLIGGLLVKHLVEAAMVRGWRDVFAADGTRGASVDLWVLSAVNFLATNIDFVVVGALLGAKDFAVYALAFRVSSVLPAQLANVTSRTAVRDLAAADEHERVAHFRRYTNRLLQAGVVGAVAAALVGLALPWFLGDRWSDLPLVVAILAVGVPARTAIGAAGGLLIADRRVGSQLVAQSAQVGGTAAVVALGALAGLPGAALGASLAAIGTTYGLQVLAAGRSATKPYGRFAAVGAVAAALVSLGAHL